MKKCEETGGVCISDKDKGHFCMCPEGTNYDDNYGCKGNCLFNNVRIIHKKCQWNKQCRKNDVI